MVRQYVQKMFGMFNYKPYCFNCGLWWELFIPVVKWIAIPTLVQFPSYNPYAIDFLNVSGLGWKS
jgi:hypothetical protein